MPSRFKGGLVTSTQLFAEGTEAVVIGVKSA
jgi:hypothetical protein